MLSPSTGAWEAAIASARSSNALSPADKSNRGAMSFADIGFSHRSGSDTGQHRRRLRRHRLHRRELQRHADLETFTVTLRQAVEHAARMQVSIFGHFRIIA